MKEVHYVTTFIVFFILLTMLSFAQVPPPAPPPAPTFECTPSWTCTQWSVCSSSGTQTRTCVDSNSCGITTGIPPESQSCTYVAPAPALSGGGRGSIVILPNKTQNVTNATAQQPITQQPAVQPIAQQPTVSDDVKEKEAELKEVQAKLKEAEEKALQARGNTSLYAIIGATLLVIVLGITIFLFVQKPRIQPQISQKSIQLQINPQLIQLRTYVVQNIQRGYNKEQIRAVLFQSGYSQQSIDEVMRSV